MGRAREALAAKVEETGRALPLGGPVASLGQIAALIRRDTEGDDREVRKLIAIQPVVPGMALLEDGALLDWFDLMLRTEAMDRALGTMPERGLGFGGHGFAEVRTVGLPGDEVTRDGATRLGALRTGDERLER